MIKKAIFITLFLNSLVINFLNSQTLIKQIDSSYNSLDSVSYIEDIILSYREDLVIRHHEMDATTIELMLLNPSYVNLDSIQMQKIIDSLMINMSFSSKNQVERQCNKFISEINDRPLHYVLNLIFDKQEKSGKHISFQPDTSKLSFNLISFDKRFKPTFYVFVVEGKFVEHHTFFSTFSKQVGKNVPKIYRKILREKPKYLLRCEQLEGGNTIWYVSNDEIYVYRIIQMKKYKLDDYIRKFM